jgi:hypothetical protein
VPDENKPKDRNQAVRQQLLKKRTEAAKKGIPLAPGEMVDDALARGTDRAVRWAKDNVSTIQWVLLAAIVGGAGYGIYEWRMGVRAERASADLIRGVLDERGRISETHTGGADDDTRDPTPTFKSYDERRAAALGAYRDVANKYKGTGAAILGRLGEAGVLLDKKDWDGALAAYRDVKGSPLAAADIDVRGRAIEGIGFALEGKGDTDGAMHAFRELENTDARGFKELGMYHQARLLFAKGDKDKAKELLKGAREKLHASGETHPFTFLETAVDDLLRRIDPSLVADRPMGGAGGKQLTPEDIERLKAQIQRQMQQAQEKSNAAGGGSTPPASSSGTP